MNSPTDALFAYGSLQWTNVQQRWFGRSLDGQSDAVTGFRLGRIAIDDPQVIAASGMEYYPVLVRDEEDSRRVEGTLYWLTEGEVAAADEYEGSDYQRQSVTTEAGQRAWVYVAAPGLEME